MVLEVYEGTRVQYEFTAASEPPRSVQGDPWRWEPPDSGFDWMEIPDEPAPGDVTATRKLQISQLARKFSAQEEHREQKHFLRLMPKPVLSYTDEPHQVEDGAIFVWAHGTNAEILMFLEARCDEHGKRSWMAGLARLGAAELKVTFADQEFWTIPAKRGRRTESYFYRAQRLTDDERATFALP